MTLILTDQPIDPEAHLRSFRSSHIAAGAVASFVGLCRANSEAGPVLALELEVYPGFTERIVAGKLRALEAPPGIYGLSVVHRHGAVLPGEVIVVVAVAAPHRRSAIALMDRTMDWLKVEAPFWKREVTAQGGRWIEPSAGDRADAARWADDDAPSDLHPVAARPSNDRSMAS